MLLLSRLWLQKVSPNSRGNDSSDQAYRENHVHNKVIQIWNYQGARAEGDDRCKVKVDHIA